VGGGWSEKWAERAGLACIRRQMGFSWKQAFVHFFSLISVFIGKGPLYFYLLNYCPSPLFLLRALKSKKYILTFKLSKSFKLPT
jgi:hypothetical protein